MLFRRSVGIGTLGLLLGQSANAADDHTSVQSDSRLVAPLEINEADFAQAWTLDSTDQTVPVAAVPDIPNGYANQFGSRKFGSASDISLYFVSRTSSAFNAWFNQEVAGLLEWAGKRVDGSDADENFIAFWRTYLSGRSISLMEFLTYMSVFLNEVGGNLGYKSEKINPPGVDHPGIAYLFDLITDKYTHTKRSKKPYNGPDNNKASSLFKDPVFNKAHGMLPFGDVLSGTNDGVWDGNIYPADRYPTSSDPRISGYILEADFFKFRGRGLIQTTWRDNYKPLVGIIQTYKGTNHRLIEYSRNWSGFDTDTVCTLSRNSDWDALFSDPERFTMVSAVITHAQRGKYLPLSLDDVTLNGADRGSIIYFGDRIGNIGYGQILKGRVRRLCLQLGLG